MKKVQRKCKACGGHFSPRPQNPDQQFCSKPECQRERKRRWQKHKRATDADYREGFGKQYTKLMLYSSSLKRASESFMAELLEWLSPAILIT